MVNKSTVFYSLKKAPSPIIGAMQAFISKNRNLQKVDCTFSLFLKALIDWNSLACTIQCLSNERLLKSSLKQPCN